jgi:hypothetical protein
MKRLIAILTENTAGSIASVSSEIGGSPLKRPKDTIFAEGGEQTECATDTTSSPSNFGLWKNSVSIGEEQQGKHGRKKSTVDKTVMYPQLKESFKQSGQDEIDNLRRSRQSDERNAGLNEPDESPASFNGGKYSDLGTWHFKYDDGSLVMRGGKPLLTASKKNAEYIVDFASKKGHNISMIAGAPRNELDETDNSPRKLPADMADYTDDDWEAWDAMVAGIGQSARNHDEREAAKRKPESNDGQGMLEAYEEFELSPYDDEDEEESGLHNGGYVRDKEDSSREVFFMRGNPYDRRVQITDRNGSGWNISPSRLIPVSDSDPAIARYFGESMAEAKTPQEFMKQISQTNPKILDNGHVDINLTPREWSLYASGMDCRKAAAELNRAFNSAANAPDATRDSVRRVVRKMMEKYSEYGAYDTSPREILEYLLDKYISDKNMSEATGDAKFDSMMGGITSKESLNTREALAFMLDLIYNSGASYKEALQQTSTSFEISPDELNALYKKQGMMENHSDDTEHDID